MSPYRNWTHPYITREKTGFHTDCCWPPKKYLTNIWVLLSASFITSPPQFLELHLRMSDGNCRPECLTDNRCNHPANSQSIVHILASSTSSTGMSDGDTCNWFHSVKQWNRGMFHGKKMRQLYTTVIHQTVNLDKLIFILRGEAKQKAAVTRTLQRHFIEFVRLFPSLQPNHFLYLFDLSHTNTHTHTQATQNDGFLPTPQGLVDPCTRLNLIFMTSACRGRKCCGEGGRRGCCGWGG